MSPIQEKYEAIMQAADAILAVEGFRRSGQKYRRTHPEGGVRWSIEFQKSRHSTSDSVSFTFWIHAEWRHRPASYEEHMPNETWYGGAGGRIGDLLPKKSDTWWDIDENTDCPQVIAQINHVLSSVALPFLKRFQTENDLDNYLRSVAREMRWNYNYAIDMLGLDLLQGKNPSVIKRRIRKIRLLRLFYFIKKDVAEATIQRVQKAYGSVQAGKRG